MPEAKYPLHIRNVRYVPYLPLAQGITPVLMAVLSLVWLFLMEHFANGSVWYMTVPAGFMVFGFGATFAMSMRLRRLCVGWWLTVDKDKLGLRGDRTLRATQLRRLVYLADPQQDYADDIAKRVVLVQLEPHQGRLTSLFCSTADLEHLNTWANANGVPVHDQRERGCQ